MPTVAVYVVVKPLGKILPTLTDLQGQEIRFLKIYGKGGIKVSRQIFCKKGGDATITIQQ